MTLLDDALNALAVHARSVADIIMAEAGTLIQEYEGSDHSLSDHLYALAKRISGIADQIDAEHTEEKG